MHVVYWSIEIKLLSKMKQIIFIIVLISCSFTSYAEVPKWVNNAKDAVFSVITYDKDGKTLNMGNGFYITDDGIGLSDYSVFKGAYRAVVIDSKGIQRSVVSVMGANEMYDVIKFRVETGGNKVYSLNINNDIPKVGATIYLLPYATQKDNGLKTGSILKVDRIQGAYSYYELSLNVSDKLVSCPLLTSEGHVFGIAQQSSDAKSDISYAIDVRFANNQKIDAVTYNNSALSQVFIKRDLPDDEKQALVLLYLYASQNSPHDYAVMLDDFIAKFPSNADGYMRRAQFKVENLQSANTLTSIEADLEKSIQVSSSKDDAYYNRAKLIYNQILNDEQYVREGWNLSQALSDIQQAIRLNPQMIYVQLEGDIQFANQKYVEAFACFDKLNHSDYASASSYYSAARAKEFLKAPIDEVLLLMDSCISFYPRPYTQEVAPYLLERARLNTVAENFRKVVSDYNDYFNVMKGQVNENFYELRGQAALQARQFQLALDDLSKCIELNPAEPIYYSELAIANMRVSRNDEAIKVLDKGLSIQSNFAEFYRLKGLALVQMKKNKEAGPLFKKAAEMGDESSNQLFKKYCE